MSTSPKTPATIDKGKYEYSRELYEIIDNDNNGNKYKLKNIDNGNVLQKQYQGYELQLIDSAEEKDGYDIVKAEKDITQLYFCKLYHDILRQSRV